MKPLTYSILASAIDDVKMWKERGINVKVSINVTSDVLEDVEFPNLLLTQLQSAGINRSRFVIEVTEAGVLDANAATMEVLARLRIKDIDISIDDFGTGFSNIEQLKKFPYSELKIDQSFISSGPSDTFANASVRASVALGRELNMRLVTEVSRPGNNGTMWRNRVSIRCRGFSSPSRCRQTHSSTGLTNETELLKSVNAI